MATPPSAQLTDPRAAITSLLAGTQPSEGDYGLWHPTITILRRALEKDGVEAVEARYRVICLNNPALVTLMAEPAPARETTASESPSECLALPEEASIDPLLGADACTWLDTYMAWSRTWAPEAFDEAHELCGLFALSTLAARRVHIPFGPRGQYTNLMLALVARTTLHTKSTAANLAKDVIRSIGLGYLLGPDRTTPEKMLSDMAGRCDLSGYDQWPMEDQDSLKHRLAFCGQRGWYAEEFGMHLKAMLQESGPYAALHGLLRIVDDCQDEYTASTVGRGEDRVKQPYLTLLASMTPADLRKGAKHGAQMWGDGFWARIGFATPEGPLKEAEFPEEAYSIPDAITMPLKRWHEALGIPDVTVEAVLDDRGKKTGEYQVTRDPLPVQHCTIDKAVRDALYRYRRALRRMVSDSSQEDSDGNYGRFSTLALRMAGLFASLENDGHIQMRHWARAQTITERMRASLHRLIERVNQAAPSQAAQQEEKILKTVADLAKSGEKATARNIGRYVHISTAQAELTLASLRESGIVEKIADGKAHIYKLAPPAAATG